VAPGSREQVCLQCLLEGALRQVSVGSYPWVLHVSFSCFSQVLLNISPRGRLEGKAGSVCEEFDDNEGGILG